MGVLLAEKAMLVSLSISTLQTRKHDAEISREVAAKHNVSEDAGRYNKVIISKDVIHGVNAIVRQARQLHYRYTLPWLDDGSRVLPTKRFDAYMSEERALRASFTALSREIKDNWQMILNSEQRRLGPMFKADDYPEPHEVEEKFDFSITINPIPTSDDFRASIQSEEAERIRKDLEARNQAAMAVAMRDLWKRLHEPIKHMAETLKDNEKTGFHKTLVTNIMDVCEILPDLNIADDPALEEMRRRIEENLCVFTSEDLKKDKELRDMTASEADEILKVMDGYV